MLCCPQVTVNGVDYQPQTASPNKKHAKAMAATVALQALGEVPNRLCFYLPRSNRIQLLLRLNIPV